MHNGYAISITIKIKRTKQNAQNNLQKIQR